MSDTIKLMESEIPRLRRYARFLTRQTDTADDLVQECLLRALENIDKWQPGTNMRAWLFTILKNAFINETRRLKRSQNFINGHPTEHPFLDGGQEANIQIKETQRAFTKLKKEHQETLVLVAIEGLKYDEAAVILDVPVGTVRSRLSRARSELREMVEGGTKEEQVPGG